MTDCEETTDREGVFVSCALLTVVVLLEDPLYCFELFGYKVSIGTLLKGVVLMVKALLGEVLFGNALFSSALCGKASCDKAPCDKAPCDKAFEHGVPM